MYRTIRQAVYGKALLYNQTVAAAYEALREVEREFTNYHYDDVTGFLCLQLECGIITLELYIATGKLITGDN